MTTVYMECPHCGDEIEVEMDYEPPDYECNVSGGYFASESPLIRYCNCALTQTEEAEICDAAEEKANELGYLGGDEDD